MKSVLGFTLVVVFCVLVLFGVLHFFDLETGQVIDWVVGTLSFIWMIIIVTVPWNAHFKAREVLDDAEISQRKNILVIDSSLAYARRVARWSLIVAIALHIFTAISLFLIAYLKVSPVGYFASGVAALLTFLRPTVRFYEYLQNRLRDIKREFRYPREDVQELLNKYTEMSKQMEAISLVLSVDEKYRGQSWRLEIDSALSEIRSVQEKHQEHTNQIESETKAEFETIREEAKQYFAKITTDSQILDSIREIAKFIKKV